MKKLFPVFLFLLFSCNTLHKTETPREQYQQLFDTIQLSRVYPDNKTFVDAIPKAKPALILDAYLKEKDNEGFDLKGFADKYFEIPGKDTPDFKTENSSLRQHIDTLWTVLKRSADTAKKGSLIPLPHAYIVPGGRFREVYYWDSFFTMLGLKESNEVETIQNMVDNFAYLIDRVGFIPNGNRTYYLSRSQPPFFALMVDLLAQIKGDKVYAKYQSQLIKEYGFWMRGTKDLKNDSANKNVVMLSDGSVLNRYWDESDQPREESFYEDVTASKFSSQSKSEFYRNIRAAAESGWDFSSRWFADGENLKTIQTTQIIPVDLNCLLYFLEQTIAKSYQLDDDKNNAEKYQTKAEKRKKAIISYCWDEDAGWFKDYNFAEKKRTSSWNLGGAFPLYFNIADTLQVGEMARNIQQKFLKPGGLVTTLNNTSQQWDAPNGWAPLQYVTIKGLENYGRHQLASSIAKRWINLNKKVFDQTGKLMEKYNVSDLKLDAGGGEYPLQDGFGWTNGVLLNLINTYEVR